MPEGRILGIRPEHLRIHHEGWALTVETVEMLGAERLIYGHLGGEWTILRMNETDAPPAIGSTIHIAPLTDRLHWFDAATGQRLPD